MRKSSSKAEQPARSRKRTGDGCCRGGGGIGDVAVIGAARSSIPSRQQANFVDKNEADLLARIDRITNTVNASYPTTTATASNTANNSSFGGVVGAGVGLHQQPSKSFFSYPAYQSGAIGAINGGIPSRRSSSSSYNPGLRVLGQELSLLTLLNSLCSPEDMEIPINDPSLFQPTLFAPGQNAQTLRLDYQQHDDESLPQITVAPILVPGSWIAGGIVPAPIPKVALINGGLGTAPVPNIEEAPVPERASLITRGLALAPIPNVTVPVPESLINGGAVPALIPKIAVAPVPELASLIIRGLALAPIPNVTVAPVSELTSLIAGGIVPAPIPKVAVATVPVPASLVNRGVVPVPKMAVAPTRSLVPAPIPKAIVPPVPVPASLVASGVSTIPVPKNVVAPVPVPASLVAPGAVQVPVGIIPASGAMLFPQYPQSQFLPFFQQLPAANIGCGQSTIPNLFYPSSPPSSLADQLLAQFAHMSGGGVLSPNLLNPTGADPNNLFLSSALPQSLSTGMPAGIGQLSTFTRRNSASTFAMSRIVSESQRPIINSTIPSGAAVHNLKPSIGSAKKARGVGTGNTRESRWMIRYNELLEVSILLLLCFPCSSNS